MAEIKVKIEGIRPLLQNRFPDETFEIEAKTKIRSGAVQEEKPETKLHRFPDGIIYEPSEHILRALTKSATNFRIGGKGKKTYKDLIESAIIITPECIPHNYQEWTIDKRSVVIPATRGRIIRLRPRLDKWELEFTIQTADPQLDKSTIKRILDYAGLYNGIGDYRPRFGGFLVTQFEEVV